MTPSPEDRGRYLATAAYIVRADAVSMADFEALRLFAQWQADQIERLTAEIESERPDGLTPAECDVALAELAERLAAMTYRKEQERLLREEAWGQAARYRDECDKKLKRLRGELEERTHQHATQLDNVVRLTAEVDRLRVTRIRRWRNWP